MQKRNIYAMYAVCFLQGMVFYSAVATLYRQQAGVSMAQMALIESVSMALTLALVLSGAIFGEAVHNAATFLSQLHYLRAGMSGAAIGVCFTVVTVFSLMGPLSAPLTVRLGRNRTGVTLMGLSAACCFTLAFTRNAWLTLALFGMLELLTALYNPLHSAMENALVTSADRATALSVNSVLASGAAVFVNMLLGPVADGSVTLATAICGGMCVISGYLFSQMKQKG